MKSTFAIAILICFTIGISTPFSAAQKLDFAFLTDLHVSPGAESESNLHEIVAEINLGTYDLVVVTGDITNTGSNAELMAVKKALDRLNVPLLIIPGNHETNWSESAGLKFNELWGNDRFLLDKNGFLLVGFNTGPYMKMGDGHVKQEDLQWLKKTLKTQMNDNKILLSFHHYPLADGLDNWDRVTEILKEYDCKAAFCGHGHRLSLFNFDGIPGIMGRPTDLKNNKGFGYNVVKVNSDSVYVYEKILGETIGNPFLAFNHRSSDVLSGLKISPKHDFSINGDYPIKPIYELKDTASIFSGPSLSGDTLLVYGNSLGWVKALHVLSKQIIWEKQFQGPIYSTPVIADGKAVFGTVDGHIKGIDIKTGNEVWSINIGRPVLAEGLSVGRFVFIGGGDKGFYKIDASNGKVIWSFDAIEGLVQGKPAISKDYVVFGAWDRNLYCLNAKTGALVWKWNNGKSQVLFSPGNIVPVISRNKVFIVAPDRYMTAIDLKTGREIWRTNNHMVRESLGISPDGNEVYAKLMNDSIVAISASEKAFSTLWKVDAGTGYDHNPCAVLASKKQVIGATKNGLVVAIDPKSKEILWKYKVGNSSVNKMVFQSSDVIWLTLIEGKVVALGKITDFK